MAGLTGNAAARRAALASVYTDAADSYTYRLQAGAGVTAVVDAEGAAPPGPAAPDSLGAAHAAPTADGGQPAAASPPEGQPPAAHSAQEVQAAGAACWHPAPAGDVPPHMLRHNPMSDLLHLTWLTINSITRERDGAPVAHTRCGRVWGGQRRRRCCGVSNLADEQFSWGGHSAADGSAARLPLSNGPSMRAAGPRPHAASSWDRAGLPGRSQAACMPCTRALYKRNTGALPGLAGPARSAAPSLSAPAGGLTAVETEEQPLLLDEPYGEASDGGLHGLHALLPWLCCLCQAAQHGPADP